MSQVVHLELYAPNARAAFVTAQKTADTRRHVQITPSHLLVALLENGAGRAAITRGGGDPEEVLAAAKGRVDALAADGDGQSYLSSDLLALMSRAESTAVRLGRASVDFECLFRAFGGTLFSLDAAAWPEAERLGAPAPTASPAKRVTFELALSRASRALQEIAPRVLAASGREQQASFRVLVTLDRIVTAFLPPYHPPELRIEQPSRGEIVIAREGRPSPRVVCAAAAPEHVVVTVHGDGAAASRRFGWDDDAQAWRSEDGEELFAELRDIVLAMYPEAAGSPT